MRRSLSREVLGPWLLTLLLFVFWPTVFAEEDDLSLRLEIGPDGQWLFVDRDQNVVGWLSEESVGDPESLSVAPPQLSGWPLRVGEVQATPTVVDVDTDGVLDVIFSTISSDGLLYVANATGAIRPAWPLSGYRGGHSQAVADVDGDGILEIFAQGSGNLAGLRTDGSSLVGWPQKSNGFATPAIGDLDGDGIPEIIANSRAGEAFVLNVDGVPRPGWPFAFENPHVVSSKGPALGDTTGDGFLEVAIPILNFNPSLYLFRRDAAILSGYPLSFVFGLGEGVSMGDMNGDGRQELVLQEAFGARILDSTGQLLPGFPVPLQPGNAAPSIGDLNGDGRLEMLWATPGGTTDLFVLQDDGTFLPGWPVEVPNFSFNSQVTLGDIDGDGGVDVVVGGFTSSSFSVTGRIYAWHADGTPLAGFPFALPEGKSILGSSVTLTDLDQDGDIDLVVGAITGLGGGGDGRVFAFDLAAPYDPTTMEWPTLGHDIRHTSRYEPPNWPPVPVAGTERFVECASPAGATVLLDGSGSYDPDSTPGRDQIASHVWFLERGTPAEQRLGHGETLAVDLPLGRHAITLRVADSYGAFATETTIVEVVDSEPPELSLAVEPAELWPPNHRMVEVSVAITVADTCDPAPGVSLVSVTSSEADDAPGPGDGETEGDVAGADLGTAEGTVWLRAERSGEGPGRTYELRYQATDTAGNGSPALARVYVPHDRGERPGEPELRVERDPATGSILLLWPAVEEAAGYDVLRASRSQVTLDASRVQFGAVQVVARGTSATSLRIVEDDAVSAGDDAVLYLLQPRTALGGLGYGLESVPWPRVPTACAGGCP